MRRKTNTAAAMASPQREGLPRLATLAVERRSRGHPARAISSAVANATTRGGSLVNSLTLWPGSVGTHPGGRARSSTSVHMPAHRRTSPTDRLGAGVRAGLAGLDGRRGAPRFTRHHALPRGGPNRVTEIPEHLLKRSKERRAAIGGEEAPAERGAAAGEARRGSRPRPPPRRRPRPPAAAAPRARPGPRAGAARGGRRPAAPEDPVLGHARAGRPAAVGLRVPGHPRAAPRRRATRPSPWARRSYARLRQLPRRQRRRRRRPRPRRGRSRPGPTTATT